jgi:hypothetical protein
MQNAAHNGFGCPFCRTAMAEESEDSEDDEDDEDDGRESFGWETEDDDEEQETTPEDEEDYALRGLRFMINQVDDENGWHSMEDDNAEDNYETRRNSQVQANQEIDQRERDDAVFITQELLREGVTAEMLVMCLLGGCHEEYIRSKQFDRVDRDVFGKIRRLIDIRENNRQQNQTQTETPVGETPVPTEPANNPPPVVRERPIAEPKIPVTPVRLLDAFNECLAE